MAWDHQVDLLAKKRQPAQPNQGAAQSQSSAADAALAQIHDRVDRGVPPDPYITDAQLAALLRRSLKTLQNQRSTSPTDFPTPMSLAGGRVRVHAREDVVDWLARQELAARSRTVHRCL